MKPNIDPDTGIAYGYVSANSLDPERVHELMYHNGVDLSYQEALAELRREVENEADLMREEIAIELSEIDHNMPEFERIALEEAKLDAMLSRWGYSGIDEFIEGEVERRAGNLYIEEPIIAGEREGVHYRTSWLGGALNFWIFKAPYSGKFQPCSPCVPGAGNLDCPDKANGIETYMPPADWFEADHQLKIEQELYHG